MSAFATACPLCGVALRLRDRPVGVRAACPDCGGALEFSTAADGAVTAIPATPIRLRPEIPKATGPRIDRPTFASVAAVAAVTLRPVGSALLGRLRDPLTVIWITAGVAGVALATAFLGLDETGVAIEPKPVAAAEAPVDSATDETKPAAVLGGQVAEDQPPAPPEPADPPLDADPPETAEPVAPVVAEKPADEGTGPRNAVLAGLTQRVVRFDQPTPVPFDRLRLQIEELAGVPIRFEDSDASERTAELTLSLADVALGEILAAACGAVGLEYVVGDDEIRLRPAAGR